jgi:N-glycosylase/DNA lyase
MPTPKKEAPTPEIVREEAKTFVAPKKVKVPVHGDVAVKKVAVNDQIIDAVESPRYPRNEQSANYRVQVIAPLTGIPMVHVAPVGWVGPAPFQFPEERIDEVIQLLTKTR